MSPARARPGCTAKSKFAASAWKLTNRRLSVAQDKAPNPVEYALAALATYQEIPYRSHADALGIPLRDVSVSLEGELDLRGFFGATEGVRPGFHQINGVVRFDSSASKEELAHLKAVVDAHYPVLDQFSNATPVEIAVAGHA